MRFSITFDRKFAGLMQKIIYSTHQQMILGTLKVVPSAIRTQLAVFQKFSEADTFFWPASQHICYSFFFIGGISDNLLLRCRIIFVATIFIFGNNIEHECGTISDLFQQLNGNCQSGRNDFCIRHPFL